MSVNEKINAETTNILRDFGAAKVAVGRYSQLLGSLQMGYTPSSQLKEVPR